MLFYSFLQQLRNISLLDLPAATVTGHQSQSNQNKLFLVIGKRVLQKNKWMSNVSSWKWFSFFWNFIICPDIQSEMNRYFQEVMHLIRHESCIGLIFIDQRRATVWSVSSDVPAMHEDAQLRSLFLRAGCSIVPRLLPSVVVNAAMRTTPETVFLPASPQWLGQRFETPPKTADSKLTLRGYIFELFNPFKSPKHTF